MALTLPRLAETTLTAVLVLATAIWVGGLGAWLCTRPAGLPQC
jgi:hypothetical protein